MKHLRRTALLLVAVACGWLTDSGDPAIAVAQVPVIKGLAIHEWGVVSVYNDVELANADMRAEWEGLPRFVYGQIDQRSLTQAQYVPVRAPVVYFHATQPVQLGFRVDFPGGKPAVWWPNNQNAPRNGESTLKDTFLQWQIALKSPQVGTTPEAPLPKGHWLGALRNVRADDVLTISSVNRFEGRYYPPQRERFIYYDGLIPGPKGAALAVAGEQVSLASRARYPLFDVTVVDRRSPGKVRAARVARLEPGSEQKALPFTESDPKAWPAAGIDALVTQLKGAGLFEDEARALGQVWKKDFFETEGLSMFYRLPQDEYDRMLPLTVNPRPEKLARVMLVHHPHCEPDLAERVLGLVKDLESNDFNVRVQAHKRLEALGRTAFVHMLRARRTTNDPEVRSRLKKILEEFEAELAFRK
jgi:hypothetical protein